MKKVILGRKLNFSLRPLISAPSGQGNSYPQFTQEKECQEVKSEISEVSLWFRMWFNPAWALLSHWQLRTMALQSPLGWWQGPARV